MHGSSRTGGAGARGVRGSLLSFVFVFSRARMCVRTTKKKAAVLLSYILGLGRAGGVSGG